MRAMRAEGFRGYQDLRLADIHKPVNKDTGLLRAEGQLLSLRQRVAFAEAKLTDTRGQLYASGTSTLLVFNR
jgi:acyl-coenzyme A thioesterase PaaI-like protein